MIVKHFIYFISAVATTPFKRVFFATVFVRTSSYPTYMQLVIEKIYLESEVSTGLFIRLFVLCSIHGHSGGLQFFRLLNFCPLG
jgi:hypothetical protein